MVFCIITGYNVLAWSNFLAYTKNINYKRLYYFKTILHIIMFICLNWMIRIIKFPCYSWYKPIKKIIGFAFPKRSRAVLVIFPFIVIPALFNHFIFKRIYQCYDFFFYLRICVDHTIFAFHCLWLNFMTKPGLSRTN